MGFLPSTNRNWMPKWEQQTKSWIRWPTWQRVSSKSPNWRIHSLQKTPYCWGRTDEVGQFHQKVIPLTPGRLQPHLKRPVANKNNSHPTLTITSIHAALPCIPSTRNYHWIPILGRSRRPLYFYLQTAIRCFEPGDISWRYIRWQLNFYLQIQQPNRNLNHNSRNNPQQSSTSSWKTNRRLPQLSLATTLLRFTGFKATPYLQCNL